MKEDNNYKRLDGDNRDIITQESVRINNVNSVSEAFFSIQNNYDSNEGWECTHYEIVKMHDDDNTIDVVLYITQFDLNKTR